MAKSIIHLSIKLVIFTETVRIELSHLQLQHGTRIADSPIVCEAQKNLSELYRLFIKLQIQPMPPIAFELARTAEDLREPLHAFEIRDLIAHAETAGTPKIIWISVDDSLAKKDKRTSTVLI